MCGCVCVCVCGDCTMGDTDKGWRRARMAQWWERSPLTNVALARSFSPCFGFFFPALRFSSLPQNQHSKFQFVQDRGFAWNPATACVTSSLNILIYKNVSCAIQTWYKCRNLIGQATQTLSAIAVQWLEVVQIMAMFYDLFDIYETLLDNLISKKIEKKKLTVLPLSKLKRFRETISACK